MDYLYGHLANGGAVGEAVITEMGSDGVQRLTKDASKALMLLFANSYPDITSSWFAEQGASTPGFDSKADLWSYAAGPSSPSGNTQTVYEQIKSLQPSSAVLVDIKSAQDAIAGVSKSVVYAIVKDKNTVPQLAGSSLAVLQTDAVLGKAEEKPTGIKPLAIVGAVVGAGVGALVAGVPGALIGGIGAGVLAQQVA